MRMTAFAYIRHNEKVSEKKKQWKTAQIAQLVEQRTENPRVTGSIPVLGTFIFLLLSKS